MPTPINLQRLNISSNFFEVLPKWISDLNKLITLNAENNNLKRLPSR